MEPEADPAHALGVEPGAPEQGPSRRVVLLTGTVAGGLALAGCTPTLQAGHHHDDVTAPERSPLPPDPADVEGGYTFFSPEEARTVDAVVGRILPGDDDDPGAVQAGVTYYIDAKLAEFETFAQPTFMQAPFAVEAASGEPAEAGPDEIAVPEADLYRYGHQSRLTAREVYVLGLAALDRYAQTRFGSLYADLAAEQQDEVLMVCEEVQERVEAGGTREEDQEFSDVVLDQAEEIFGDVGPGEFFGQVREDTIEGMFADPAYGGNRNLAGWYLIGYPGAQRSYSPHEMLHGTTKQPQAMHGLTVMNPDTANGGRPALERHPHEVGSG